jgi:anti-sigma B factor antagonist
MTSKLTARAASDGIVVAGVVGEVDIGCAAGLLKQLLSIVDRHGRGRGLVLDLSRVTFFDCTGVSVLMCVRRQAEAQGGGLWLAAPSRPVTWVLGLLKLLPAFRIIPFAPPPWGELPLPATRMARMSVPRLMPVAPVAPVAPAELAVVGAQASVRGGRVPVAAGPPTSCERSGPPG